MDKAADDLSARRRRCDRSRNAYAFVAVCRDGRGDCLGKAQFCARRSQVGADSFRHAHDAIDDCLHCFARFGNSALDCFLPLALFSVMGIRLLLLGRQFCDRRLRRCRSSTDVANLGSSGKHHRRADVWIVGELPVRHREQANRP